MRIAVLGAAALSLACIPAASAGDAGAPAKPPFRITWTKGRCANCRFAQMISDIDFSGAGGLWATGYLPPGEQGNGDWTTLHSLDAGRTWWEIRHSGSHGMGPVASFAIPNDGWLLVPNSMDPVGDAYAVEAASFTNDGGAHWHRLPLPGDFVENLYYLGRGSGFAWTSSWSDKKKALYFTSSRGRAWQRVAVFDEFQFPQMQFWDSRRFILAGCEGRHVVVRSTEDGGQSWSRTALQLPSTSAPNDLCAGAIDGVTLAPDGAAFLLVSKWNFGIGDTQGYVGVWRSSDFGRSWQRTYWSEFAEPPEQLTWFHGPYRLGNLILVFAEAPKSNYALVSRDGGGNWLRRALPRRLSGCAEAPDRLICATHGFNSAIVRPS